MLIYSRIHRQLSGHCIMETGSLHLERLLLP